LPVRGKRAGNILSFCRQAGQRIANVAVMMHVAEPMRQLGSLPSTQWWGNTEVQIDNVWRHAAGLFADCPVYAAPATVGTVENAGHRLLA
jgi:hypothetical protein